MAQLIMRSADVTTSNTLLEKKLRAPARNHAVRAFLCPVQPASEGENDDQPHHQEAKPIASHGVEGKGAMFRSVGMTVEAAGDKMAALLILNHLTFTGSRINQAAGG